MCEMADDIAERPFTECHRGRSHRYGSRWAFTQTSKFSHPHHVSAQVDTEDGDGAQGQRDVGDDEEEEGV